MGVVERLEHGGCVKRHKTIDLFSIDKKERNEFAYNVFRAQPALASDLEKFFKSKSAYAVAA